MTTNVPISDSPSIDLTLLPLEKTAADLQSLGLQLVTILLSGKKQPVLSHLLSPTLVKLLLPGTSIITPPLTYGASRSRPRWVQRREVLMVISWIKRLPVLSRLFRPVARLTFIRQILLVWRSHAPQYNDLVERAARNQITSSDWQREVNRRLFGGLYGRPPKSMPVVLWPLIGEMAWNDLVAQREAGWQIYTCLRSRYLFYPVFGPAPRLSSRTFWALIALAKPVSAGLILTDGQRDRYRAAYHLQRIASEQVVGEGWAGFWDQWLIWQMYRRWPAAFVPKTELVDSLISLPLFGHFSGEPPVTPDQSEVKVCKMATINWRDAAPDWLLRQYQEWKI